MNGTIFTENYSKNEGGGLAMDEECYSRLVNCRFIRNSTRYNGGAIQNIESELDLIRCSFIANSTSLGHGGAVYCKKDDVNVVNCVFNGNDADERGGGLCFYTSTALIANCTFSANQAKSGEAFACYSGTTFPSPSTVTVQNSILWDSGNEMYNGDSSSLSVTYCAVYGGYAGTGNKQYNPTFESTRGADGVAGNEDDDLRLSASSGYIDYGNNNLVPAGLTEDIIHMPRFLDKADKSDQGVGTAPIVDRGAYEYGDLSMLTPPIADAGDDFVLPADSQGNAKIILDGTGSYDPEGDPLQYLWTWTYNFQDFNSVLARPTLTLPVGQYTFNLEVSDGVTTSDPNSVMVSVVSSGRPPVADAGSNQTIVLTSGSYATVQLDGSGSTDPDGDSLQYTWTWQIGSTPYSSIGIAPQIQLPIGIHVISLVVYDGIYYSSTDTVTITVKAENRAPVADAGPDQTVSTLAGTMASVTLDGSGSTDPDGDTLTYTWQWVANSTLNQVSGVNPTISLEVGTYNITLLVSDGALSDTDVVTITVNEVQNQPPVADAGPDQTVTTSGTTANVTLDGSGSYDPDGAIIQYYWAWTGGSASGVSPTVSLAVGIHSIRLHVYDGIDYSTTDTVVITVLQGNQKPVANAGPDQTVVTTGTSANVTLNGSGSYDPDGSITQYLWTWSGGSATGVTPTVNFAVGTRTVSLIVFDGTDYSDVDTVVITVTKTNQKPIANAGPDQTVTTTGSTANVTLDGSGSYDPDGTISMYIWTWSGGSATGVSPTVNLAVGTHTISLIVYDGAAYSNADYVTITVTQTNQKPVADAGSDQTVALPTGSTTASVTLDGSGSYDPEGASLSYIWTYVVGSVTYSKTGVSPTISLPVGSYTIQLVVYDGTQWSSVDTVVITVVQVNQKPIADAGDDQTVSTTGSSANVTLGRQRFLRSRWHHHPVPLDLVRWIDDGCESHGQLCCGDTYGQPDRLRW